MSPQFETLTVHLMDGGIHASSDLGTVPLGIYRQPYKDTNEVDLFVVIAPETGDIIYPSAPDDATETSGGNPDPLLLVALLLEAQDHLGAIRHSTATGKATEYTTFAKPKPDSRLERSWQAMRTLSTRLGDALLGNNVALIIEELKLDWDIQHFGACYYLILVYPVLVSLQ
jgi:hypothetical protein